MASVYETLAGGAVRVERVPYDPGDENALQVTLQARYDDGWRLKASHIVARKVSGSALSGDLVMAPALLCIFER